ncbi:hypothetical protein IJI55_00255 [Candidatus Saccharibacteria bacterium]|nr:hypothetical protein [Candidatus Saccharibacteria bacterium]MBR3323304.1 hypothetical protein [Candidatus Saccharibacteria bacterium]
MSEQIRIDVPDNNYSDEPISEPRRPKIQSHKVSTGRKKTETEEKLENIQERTEQRLSNLHKKLKDLEDEISQLTAEKEDIESKLRVFETALEKL